MLITSSFLLYRYQKKSAKLIQEFTASANQVKHKSFTGLQSLT